MNLLTLCLGILMAHVTMGQKCNFSNCIRCGWVPKTGQNKMVMDQGSRAFNFGYGSGQGLDWFTSAESEFQCTLCDVGNSFFLQTDGTCARVENSGPFGKCLSADISGTCLACPSNQFFSQLLNTCVDMLRPLANCQVQNQDGTCILCNSQFYFNYTTNTCVPVYNPDTNCQMWGSAIKCSLCAQGFVVNPNDNRCTKLNKIDNCYSYNMLKCNGCIRDYALDENISRTFQFNLSNNRNQNPGALISMLSDFKLNYMADKNQVMCSVGRIDNCIQYTNNNICSSCAAGYYLSSTQNSCMPFPTYISVYCQVFGLASDVLTCTTCKTGYKLNSGSCSILDDYKPGCNLYNTVSGNDCLQCEPDQYLSSGACLKRTVRILNCAVYQKDADDCATCIQGYWYFTNANFKGCLPAIPNCLPGKNVVSQPGTVLQVVTCDECAQNYLLSQDKLGCNPITTPIGNCQNYNKYNYCINCGFQFLISGTCTKSHSKIARCNDYSQLNYNQCKTCRGNAFKRTAQSYCYNPKVTAVANCKTYNFMLQRCTLCNDKYHESDDGASCIAYPSNCVTYSKTLKACTKCDNGFGLSLQYTQNTDIWTWSCVPPTVYKSNMCSVKSYWDGTTHSATAEKQYFFGLECDQCLNQAIPTTGKYQCFSTSELAYMQDYTLKFSTTDKCIKYSYYAQATPTNANIIRGQKAADFMWYCEACEAGYWLKIDTETSTVINPRSCIQNQVSNGSTLACYYSILQTIAGDAFQYAQNQCYVYTDLSGTKENKQYGYIAMNTNKDLQSDTDLGNYNVAEMLTKQDNMTVIECPANGTGEFFYKQFALADLQLVKASNVSLSSQTISSITHPLYTNIGFTKCRRETTKLATEVDNCKFYQLKGADSFCIACKENSVGEFNDTDTGNNYLQVKKCTANYDPNYNPLTDWQNIRPYFGKFLSIKKCTTAGQIPIILLTGEDASKISLAQADQKFFKLFLDGATVIAKNAVHCMKAQSRLDIIQALSLKIDVANVTALPANCAYGVLNTFQTNLNFDNRQGDTGNDAKRALSCLQCKPGYKPTYWTTDYTIDGLKVHHVKSCTPIQFCNQTVSNIYLDACGQCADGFAYTFEFTNTTVSKINYDQCVWAGSLKSNCLAVKGSNNIYGLEKNGFAQTSVSSCVLCKKGFAMSNDGKICVQENASQCATSSYVKADMSIFVNTGFKITGDTTTMHKIRDLKYLSFYFQNGGRGCNQCTSGYVSIYRANVNNDVKNYPVINGIIDGTASNENKYIWTKTDIGTNRQLCAAQVHKQINYDNGIPNCQNYYDDPDNAGTLKCKTCLSGYVVKSDYLACYPIDQLQNCVVATSENQCQKCAAGFLLLTGSSGNSNHLEDAVHKGHCVPHPIPKCEKYAETAVDISAAFTYNGQNVTAYTGFCTKCQPGFFRNAFGHCSPGPVPKCQYYDVVTNAADQPKCLTCMKDYELVRVPVNAEGSNPVNEAYQCVPTNKDLGCSSKLANYGYSFDDNKPNVNFNCRSCDSAFNMVVALNASQIVEQTLVKTDCLENIRVPNCRVYKQIYADNNTLRTTMQQCTECQRTHFLKSTINNITQCFPRKNFDPKCSTFNLTEDKCTSCLDGHYLSTDGTRCVQFPYQVEFCTQYKDKECVQCSSTTTAVYLSLGKCLLVPTANIVKDCLIYANQVTCTQCKAKFYLTNNQCNAYEVQNCILQTKGSICDKCDNGFVFNDQSKAQCVTVTVANCETLNQETKLCSVCTEGYYLQADGTCGMADLIPGCKRYDTKTTCTKCESQLFLNQMRNMCLYNAGELHRCENTIVTPQPICSQCLPNFKLVNGQCTQPAFMNNDHSFNNIRGCLIQSITNPNLCEVCQSGFTMNSTMTCEGITVTPPPVTPITPVDPKKNSALRILVKALGVITFLLLFQYYYIYIITFG